MKRQKKTHWRVFGIFPATFSEKDGFVMDDNWFNKWFDWLFAIFCFVNAIAHEVQGLEPMFWATKKK